MSPARDRTYVLRELGYAVSKSMRDMPGLLLCSDEPV
jgi:hypothetical protein